MDGRLTVRADLNEILALTDLVNRYNQITLERALALIQNRGSGMEEEFLELLQYVPRARLGAGANRPFALRLGYLLAADAGKSRPDEEIDGETLDLAAAIEMTNCTITHIYDNIIDDDSEVAKTPSLHRVHGVGEALLAGDALIAVARGAVTARARNLDRCWEIIDTFDQIVLDCDRGQHLDIRFGQASEATAEDCDHINDLRTGQFLRRSAEIGAQAAGADAETFGQIRKAFHYYGRAIQDSNDYVDIVKATSPTGDGGWQDVVLWKKTKPLLFAAEMASRPERNRLLGVLGSENATTPAVLEALDIVRNSGAMERARAEIAETIEQGMLALECLPESPARTDALAYFEFVRSIDELLKRKAELHSKPSAQDAESENL